MSGYGLECCYTRETNRTNQELRGWEEDSDAIDGSHQETLRDSDNDAVDIRLILARYSCMHIVAESLGLSESFDSIRANWRDDQEDTKHVRN